MKKKNLFTLALKDFFTPYFLTLALAPMVITLLLLFSALSYGAQMLHEKINTLRIEKTSTEYSTPSQTISQSSLSITVDENQSESSSLTDIDPMALLESLKSSQILSSMLENDILRWIIEKIILLAAGYFLLILSVIIAVIIVGFFTPLVVRKLKSRYYPPFKIIGHGNLFEIVWYALKSFLVMLLLYLLLIPFYFIPILNIIAFNLPAYYFFHKMLVFDVGSTINTKPEYFRIMVLAGNQIRLRTFMIYLLTLIPFVAIFFPLFFVIYLSHLFINETIELRGAPRE
ncbi:MAG: EI24 domain-containing protein [Campylobacterales bacterium]|nr:EI24 domain-containing protein [Campylobacterales bacterium]